MDNFAREIAALRPMLVRIARQKLRNDAWAEDAVSEAIVAALEQPTAYAGRAQLGTWLVGSLKYKIVDQVRRHTREHQQLDEHEDEHAGAFDDLAAPAAVHCPQERLSQREFMAAFGESLRALPPRQGRAFVLRNWMGAATDEICRDLGVNENNLAVMLHRARNRLREALQPHRPAGMAA
jgi:RNA polymerase sigma-70 factor, ECF subfamily